MIYLCTKFLYLKHTEFEHRTLIIRITTNERWDGVETILINDWNFLYLSLSSNKFKRKTKQHKNKSRQLQQSKQICNEKATTKKPTMIQKIKSSLER